MGGPLVSRPSSRPRKEAVKRHIHAIKQRVRALHSASQEQVIKVLNPVIRGWANYYRTVPSKKTFSWCDHTVYVQLTQWARHKHPTRGRKWIARNYWRTKEQRHWVFMTLQGVELRDHSQTAISYHTKVRGGASPYDGQLLYWSQRLKHHPLIEGKLARQSSHLRKTLGRTSCCEGSSSSAHGDGARWPVIRRSDEASSRYG